MGRPLHEPTDQTRKTVEAMSAYGIKQQDIALVLSISKPTLEKHYRLELDTACAKANSKVAESLYNKATGSHPQAVTAAIFWMKTRGGWKDTSRIEHTGPNGGPIQNVDLSGATAEDLDRLESLLGLSLGSGSSGEGETGEGGGAGAGRV